MTSFGGATVFAPAGTFNCSRQPAHCTAWLGAGYQAQHCEMSRFDQTGKYSRGTLSL